MDGGGGFGGGGGGGAALVRPGEESQQVGDDAALVHRLRKELRSVPLEDTVLEAIEMMAVEHDLDMEELAFAVEVRIPELRATLVREGIEGVYRLDFALAIYLYTINAPKLYEIINSASHATDRDSGPGGLSPRLRACLPYIKFLDAALAALPAKYLHTGRVNRGIKWAFPSPETHDPERHFPIGKRFFWYEFKSAARDFQVMYQPCFCGESGPRTIFTIDACQSYRIEAFSHFPTEAEVLFRPLAHFEVTFTQKKLLAKHLQPGAPKGGFPDEVRPPALPAWLPACRRERCWQYSAHTSAQRRKWLTRSNIVCDRST